MPAFRLPVRQLVEFLLRTGSIDSRFTGFDRANEGARIHRNLQKAAGEGYAAEVFLSGEREAAGIPFTKAAMPWRLPLQPPRTCSSRMTPCSSTSTCICWEQTPRGRNVYVIDILLFRMFCGMCMIFLY